MNKLEFYCDFCGLVTIRVIGNEACFKWFTEYFPGLLSFEKRAADYIIDYRGHIPPNLFVPADAQSVKGFAGANYAVWRRAGKVVSYAGSEQKRGAHLLVRSGNTVGVSVHSEFEHEEIVVRVAREIILRKLFDLGFVPFHASAVVIDDRAIVFLGPRNAGKTTCLFAFCGYGEASPLGSDIILMRNQSALIEVCSWPVRVSYYPAAMRIIGGNSDSFTDIGTHEGKARITPLDFSRLVGRSWVWRSTLDQAVFVDCDLRARRYSISPLPDVRKGAVKPHMYDDWDWGDFLQLSDKKPELDAIFESVQIQEFNGNICGYVLERKAAAILRDNYFPHERIDLRPLAAGEGWNFEATVAKRRYFVKLLDTRSQKEDGFSEVMVAKKLARAGIPVPVYVNAINGHSVFHFAQFHMIVQEWINAEPVAKHSASPDYLSKMVKLLGQTNRCLREHQLSTKWDGLFTNANYAIARTEELVRNEFRSKDRANNSQVENILLDKIRRMRIFFATNFIDMKILTYVNSHGDYSCMQTMSRGGELSVVTDWSRASRVPAVWELLRSYSLSSAECAKCQLDEDGLNRYVNLYRSLVPLSNYDLDAMKLVYAAQLFRSNFGFEEYVIEGSTRNLDYAIWRHEFATMLTASDARSK